MTQSSQSTDTNPLPLVDIVALVAGATRGAGRGIAVALGEAGATVYCTGRSTRDARSDVDRTETIDETAELVTAAGGNGIPVAVDHLDPDQVRDLAARIDADHGRLDVLVNDIAGEHLADWVDKIWEHDLDRGLRLLHTAVDTHLVTSHHLLPLMIGEPGGLVVEVTDGTRAYNEGHYRVSAFVDLAKAATNRLAFVLGTELEPHGVCAVAVTPGWLRSEMMLDGFEVTEENWQDCLDPDRADGPSAPPGFATSETPRFVGRGIAAVAADPEKMRWTKGSVTVGELAEHYGFTDVDGSRPDAWRYIADVVEGGKEADASAYR